MKRTSIPSHSNERNGATPYSQYGVALSRSLLRGLEKRGVYCQTSISVEHQHLAKKFVLRGVESGGGVSDMGRYVAFVGVDGKSIPWLQPIDSFAGNGRHAVVVAPEFLRVDMLRVGRTYEVAVTRHSLVEDEKGKRPRMVCSLVFRAHDGTLGLDLWEHKNQHLRGKSMPEFLTSAGEPREIPSHLIDVVGRVTGALNCLACKHTHIATARTL